MIISKIDGIKCKNLNGLSLNCYKNGITLFEYFVKYEGLIIPNCPACGNKRKFRSFVNGKPEFSHTCCSESCIRNIQGKRVYTEKQRSEARKKRFRYLALRTGKTAWERKSRGLMSYLEKWFNDEIIKKHKLSNKYDIIYNYPIYPYFVDFAFLNIKLAVELDGRCHFVNGKKRIDHDIKRDINIIGKGWKVYRIRFDEINQKTKDEFLLFLNAIKDRAPKVYGNNLYKYSEIKRKHKTRKQYLDDLRKNTLQKQLPKINLILNSGIDFSKHGWVKKVSVIINKSSRKVSVWMKKYMLEFYKSKCIKRKNSGEGIPRKYGTKDSYLKARSDKYEELTKNRIEKVNNEIYLGHIDFSDDWINKISDIIKIHRPGIYSWLKVYMPHLMINCKRKYFLFKSKNRYNRSY